MLVHRENESLLVYGKRDGNYECPEVYAGHVCRSPYDEAQDHIRSVCDAIGVPDEVVTECLRLIPPEKL